MTTRPIRAKLKTAYHLTRPVFDPFRFKGIPAYFRYFRDLSRYKKLDPTAVISLGDLQPQIYQKQLAHGVDHHYFYQSAWAFRLIADAKVDSHVDIASDHAFVGMLSSLIDVTFVDIRSLDVTLDRLETKAGDILALPYGDQELRSVSCLHVIEHIGLGRYGDSIDPQGTRKAAAELKRVLAPNADLYLSLPIGRERIAFNAHRIHSPTTVLSMFKGLDLIEFSSVSDTGEYLRDADLHSFEDAAYSCGLFHFRAPAQAA